MWVFLVPVAIWGVKKMLESDSHSSSSSYDDAQAERDRRALLLSRAQEESARLLQATLARWGVECPEARIQQLLSLADTPQWRVELEKHFAATDQAEHLRQAQAAAMGSVQALQALRAQMEQLQARVAHGAVRGQPGICLISR
jgi:hypothetical protein